MEGHVLSRIFTWRPAVNNGELATVPELAALAGEGHATEGGAAEVEMGAAVGAVAAGALVGDNDGDRTPRADAAVQALHLVARPAPFPVLEQHWTHRPHSRPQWLHVHQRPVPTRPSVAAIAFGAAVPGGGGGVPMQVRQAVLRLGLGYSRHINHQTTVNDHQNDKTKPNSAALHCCLCLAAASPPPPPSKKNKTT